MSLIKLQEVSKFYKTQSGVSVGMNKITANFDIGEFICISGESGSGKSTLLNVISGLDGYEEGELFLNNEETSHYTISDWEKYRSQFIGFIFQNYNIIDSYSVYQNVLFALELQNYPHHLRKQRASELIDKVGLTKQKHQKASKLSGGQKQRTAIARALAKDCPIIVADEPTGNLDSESAKSIMNLLHGISVDKLVIVVTHDYDQVKDYATRKITMHDGSIIEDQLLIKTETKQADLKTIMPMRFIDKVNFTFRNIFSQPKRFLFMLILSLLMASLFIFIYAEEMKSLDEVGLTTTNQAFPNTPLTRVLVENRDSSPLTNDDIEKLTKINDNRAVYVNGKNFINDTTLALMILNDGQEYYYHYNNISYTDSTSTLNVKDIEGKLPSNVNEIVITKPANNFNQDIYLGDKVYLSNSYYREGTIDSDKYFIIVGFDKLERQTLYFSEEYLSQSSYLPQVNDESKLNDIYDDFFNYNPLTNISYQLLIDGVSYDLDLTMQDSSFAVNEEILVNSSSVIKISVQYEDYVIEDYPLNNLSFEYNEYKKNYTLVINNNHDSYDSSNKVVDYFVKQLSDIYSYKLRNVASLQVGNLKEGKNLIEKLDNQKYRIYYPASVKEEFSQILYHLRAVLTIIILSVSGLLLVSIMVAVNKNLLNARKKDFAIYRSIGSSKKLLSESLILEQVFITLFSFILSYLVLFVLSKTTTLFASWAYIKWNHFLLLFVLFLVFGVYLGLKFNRKVFNQSVIETLSESKEDNI